jgi:hypothetical protein
MSDAVSRLKFIKRVIGSLKNDVTDINVLEYWLRRLHGIEPAPKPQGSEVDELDAMYGTRKPVCSDDEFYFWTGYLMQKHRVMVGFAKFKNKELTNRPRCWHCIALERGLNITGDNKCRYTTKSQPKPRTLHSKPQSLQMPEQH